MDIEEGLRLLATERQKDALAPATVIAPSHLAALQLRRRLAGISPFAAVRFEPAARIAELLAAGHLAAAGRRPLARPIADLLTERIALESRGPLERICELPGYVRMLRRFFRRLRRGGIKSAADISMLPSDATLREVLRLYGLFRQETAAFYDEEDLLEAATAVIDSGRSEFVHELGQLYFMQWPALSQAEADFLAALSRKAPRFVELETIASSIETRFLLSPDPARECREVAREVLSALESDVALHEIAVFHGADHRYQRLLREAFQAADIPTAPMPGIPLVETATGRGVLALAMLPGQEFSRTAVMDFLAVSPIREYLPSTSGQVRASTTEWDRLSREAG
ncbi:MAG TPA: hypothetical protein VNL15_08370, partial [Dehalococcoidia bacterium]|nr:hypothetical protein [Dehalococcoidia bacterium]